MNRLIALAFQLLKEVHALVRLLDRVQLFPTGLAHPSVRRVDFAAMGAGGLSRHSPLDRTNSIDIDAVHLRVQCPLSAFDSSFLEMKLKR